MNQNRVTQIEILIAIAGVLLFVILAIQVFTWMNYRTQESCREASGLNLEMPGRCGEYR
jgi:uncharacterized membrane protein